MKTIIIFLVSIFLSIQLLYAQDFWEYIETPDGFSIKSAFIASNGYVFIGGNDGVYRSIDNCETWQFNSDICSYPFAEDSDNNIISGYLYITNDFGDSWQVLYEDSWGSNLFFSENDNLFFTTWDSDLQGTVIAKCTNLGDPWNNVLEIPGSHTMINDFAETFNGNLYACIWEYYFYQENGVYRSTNGGDNWEFVDIADDGFTALAVNSEDEIFAASYYEGLFISDDYGDTWEQKHMYTINDLFIDANDVLYAATEDFGIYRSFDKGDTWEDISSGLYSLSKDNLVQSPDGYLYCTPSLYRSIEPVSNSINYDKTNNNIDIYPNPSKGIFTVNRNFLQEIENISINDLTGKPVQFHYTENKNQLKLRILNCLPGIYILTIFGNNEQYFQKIFITNI